MFLQSIIYNTLKIDNGPANIPCSWSFDIYICVMFANTQ